MRTLSICAICVFCSTLLSAQTIQVSGRVINAKQLPLDRVTVHVLNSTGSVLTDADGKFELSLPGAKAVPVIFSHAGYADQIQLLSPGGNAPTITMLPDYVALAETVVTAQKKEEELQHTPLAITALNERQVEAYRLTNSEQLSGIAPNLFLANPGDQRNVASIRGVSTTSYDPAVGTYIDGVSQFSLDTYIPTLFDVQRIEVLRGPQSTLYGRNATGGIINIITKAPENTLRGRLGVEIGNYGSTRLQGAASGPIVKDRLYAGLAAQYDEEDGYYRNDFTGKRFDKQHGWIGNFYLRYKASSRFSAALNAKHRDYKNNGAFPLAPSPNDALEHPFLVNQDATATMNDLTSNVSLSLNYAATEISVVSQTAWQQNYRYYDAPLDGDFSPADAVTIINDYGKKWNRVGVWTQEFRVSNRAAEDAISWNAGVYLFSQMVPNKQATHFGEDAALVGSPQTNYSILTRSNGENKGAAVFAQTDIPIAEKVKLTAGLRYDYENKHLNVGADYVVDPDPNPVFPVIADTAATTHFTAFSPTLSISYQPTTLNLLYARYSRGFRAGGYTSIAPDPGQPPLYSFLPEHSDSWEIGSKNEFADRLLLLNMAVFLNRIQDAQIPTLILPDAIVVTRNAGKLESYGAELELQFQPIPHLLVAGNAGYTHARYRQLDLPEDNSPKDYSGNRQVYSPDYNAHLMAQYQIVSEKTGVTIGVRGELFQFGTTYFDLKNNIQQSPYSLLNAALFGEYKMVTLTLWANNLTDKRYIRYAYDFGAVHLGNPMTMGVRLAFRFGANHRR